MLDRRWRRAITGFLTHERAGGKPETTIKARRYHLEHLARRTESGPWELTAEEIVEYAAAQTWAQDTRRGRRTTLVRFYEWAIAEGHAETNIAERLPKVRVRQAAARPAPNRAYHEALAKAGPRETLMLRLAGEVGMRRGEVARVHSDDLIEDLVGHSLLVHGKGGHERVVPLPTSLGHALAEAEPGYLFPGNEDGHLSPRYVGILVRDLLPDGLTMHQLRHRFATRLYASQRDILLVQTMLGHASVGTTQRYVRFDRTIMRDAVQRLADDERASA